MSPTPQAIHPEAHEAIKQAFAGQALPHPHFQTMTITPEAWQGLVSTFGPALVALFQAIIARISGGQSPQAPPQP